MEAFNNRGIAGYQKGDYDGAVADWTKAVKLNPGFWRAWYVLAVVHSEKRRRKECLEALRNLLRLQPWLKAKVRNEAPFRWLRDDPEFKRLTK